MRIPTLSSTHLQYLLFEQGIAPAILNFFINGAIAWFSFRSLTVVSLWGSQSIASDTVATAFFLPFISCLISTPLTHREVRRRRITPIKWFCDPQSTIQRYFNSLFFRAIGFGTISIVSVSPISLFVFSIFSISEFNFWQFLIFKASFAAGLAMIVTPIIGLYALGDLEANRKDSKVNVQR